MNTEHKEQAKLPANRGANACYAEAEDKDKRRIKIVRFDPNTLIQIFHWQRKPPHFIALPIRDDLPEDVEVISINAEWRSRTIEVMVWHPTFKIVKLGEMPPYIPDVYEEFRAVPFNELKA